MIWNALSYSFHCPYLMHIFQYISFYQYKIYLAYNLHFILSFSNPGILVYICTTWCPYKGLLLSFLIYILLYTFPIPSFQFPIMLYYSVWMKPLQISSFFYLLPPVYKPYPYYLSLLHAIILVYRPSLSISYQTFTLPRIQHPQFATI